MDTDIQVLVVAGALVRLKRSRFLALPAELRNRVYDYVFADLEDLAIRVTLHPGGPDSPGVYWLRSDFPLSRTTNHFRPNFFAVRFTCRRIARETSGYWYRKVSLYSSHYDWGTVAPMFGEVSITPYLMSRWKQIEHLELDDLSLYSSARPGIGIDIQERMRPTLQYLGGPEHHRNVTVISIIRPPPWYPYYRAWPPARFMQHFLGLLSFFRGQFPALGEVRVVSSGPNPRTHRFRLDDAGQLLGWYTKEYIYAISIQDWD
ncbi:hypothetical protein LTR37_014481 [Vermiconidia calcicola]|uniref:Uncharacterized protein n=1 Tax=Vermiconidia calcicola TaxID=1690605 RepID=A0ACC3MV02_9PEZI|nr:hypothetical protein LTR37_014481 [Vermiconidia calcicola]